MFKNAALYSLAFAFCFPVTVAMKVSPCRLWLNQLQKCQNTSLILLELLLICQFLNIYELRSINWSQFVVLSAIILEPLLQQVCVAMVVTLASSFSSFVIFIILLIFASPLSGFQPIKIESICHLQQFYT